MQQVLPTMRWAVRIVDSTVRAVMRRSSPCGAKKHAPEECLIRDPIPIQAAQQQPTHKRERDQGEEKKEEEQKENDSTAPAAKKPSVKA
jgi:hypothetical protein